MNTLYISPTGAGLKNGSDWANAGTLSQLPGFITKAGAGGSVLLRADQGAYHTTSSAISIDSGGTAGAPVTIKGVDGSGADMHAEFVGTRDVTVTATSAQGSQVFRLLSGANHLSFRSE